MNQYGPLSENLRADQFPLPEASPPVATGHGSDGGPPVVASSDLTALGPTSKSLTALSVPPANRRRQPAAL